MTQQLEDEGVSEFDKAFDQWMTTLREKRAAFPKVPMRATLSTPAEVIPDHPSERQNRGTLMSIHRYLFNSLHCEINSDANSGV